MARAYAEIVAQSAQTSRWVAFHEFFHEFFHEWCDHSRSERALLIAEEALSGGELAMLDVVDPLPDTRPGALPIAERDCRWRWAVFRAAVADYLPAARRWSLPHG